MMSESIERFQASIKSLDVFISGINNHINTEIHKTIEENKDHIEPFLLAQAFFRYDETESEDGEIHPMEIIKEKYSDEDGSVLMIEQEDSFKIKHKNPEDRIEFNRSMQELSMTSGQKKILYESSLISLATYFELLISGVLKDHIKKYPDILNVKDKSLKFNELINFESIEAAKTHLLEKEINDLMFDGFRDWINFLKNKLKINFSNIEHLMNEVEEILLRRHLIVHNGGEVNAIYLNKVNVETNLMIGQNVPLNSNYLNKSIELIEYFGINVSLMIWLKANIREENSITLMHNFCMDYMKKGKWDIVKSICELILDSKCSDASRIVAQVNKWLSIKRLGAFETISAQVESYDMSALDVSFKVSRAALLDKHDEILKMLEGGLSKTLNENDLVTWPILEDFRETEHYKELLEKLGLSSSEEDLVVTSNKDD